jgi:hypothetical protein
MSVYALWFPVGAFVGDPDQLVGIYPDHAAARTVELSLKTSSEIYDYLYITKIEMGKAYGLSDDDDSEFVGERV